MKIQGIYCIEHVKSGRKYYGSSLDIKRRFANHKTSLRNNRHHCIYLQRAVNKYGLDEFRFYIAEETKDKTKHDLFNMERKYIDDNKNGFNIGSVGGGDNITNHPNRAEIVKKIKSSVTQKINLMSDVERKKKFGKCGENNGRWKNGISKQKKICPVCNTNYIRFKSISCNQCNKLGKLNPFYGKKHTNETILKLKSKIPWTKNANPEEISYTKTYEIVYEDKSTKRVFGLKSIAKEFNTSIANVSVTIERMKNNSLPTKRSRFYGIFIKEVV